MNKYQKIVIVVAVVLAALNGLYPPYEAEYLHGGEHQLFRKYMGYHSIFEPPSSTEISDVFEFNQSDVSKLWVRRGICARIIATQVWLQLTTLVISTFGIVALLGYSKVASPPISS